jgi:hypothetical protein
MGTKAESVQTEFGGREFFLSSGLRVTWRVSDKGVYHACLLTRMHQTVCGTITRLFHFGTPKYEQRSLTADSKDPSRSVMTCGRCAEIVRCRRVK